MNHYGEFAGAACSVQGEDSELLQAAAAAAAALPGAAQASPLVAYAAQCAKRLQEALEAPASREGAGAGVGGASGGSLLVCGTAAQADDALTGLDAESEAGAPPVHRAVRLAASFASLRALAAVGRRSPLQLLVEARTQAPGEAGPAAEATEGAPAAARALRLPALSFQALAGGRRAAAAWDAVSGPAAPPPAGATDALAALLGGGAAGDAAAAGRLAADRHVMPFASLGIIPVHSQPPEPAEAGSDEGKEAEDGAEAAAAGSAAASAATVWAARPAEAQAAADRVAAALASIVASLGVQWVAGAGGAMCPSLSEAALLRGAAAAAELACSQTGGSDLSEAAARAAAVVRESAGAFASLPDVAESGPGAAARKRAMRGCWLLQQALRVAGGAGPAGSALKVSLLAGASEWAVSREALQAEEEARAAAAAAASDAKGGKKKAAAKSGKSAGKKGAKAEPEAEAPADELDDESADTDGPLQYDINAAAGPTGGAGARVGVEEGEARRAMREVVGSEGLRRLLLRAARALPVMALGDAFTDCDGDEAAQAAKLLPALGMSGAPALAVGAAGEEEGAGEAEDGAPSRRGALCACVDVGGAAAPASATELLARLQAAAASGGRVTLRADGCDAVDEALADVTVAAGVCLVFLGSPSGCAARAVAARLEGLSAADATIRPRSWDEILPAEA